MIVMGSEGVPYSRSSDIPYDLHGATRVEGELVSLSVALRPEPRGRLLLLASSLNSLSSPASAPESSGQEQSLADTHTHTLCSRPCRSCSGECLFVHIFCVLFVVKLLKRAQF